MIKFGDLFTAFDLLFAVLVRMVSSPSQCPGLAGKVCNHFLHTMKNPHSLCSSCRGKEYIVDGRGSDCHDWTDGLWTKVSAYRAKLAIQWEKKEERKAKSSSPSFSCFLPSNLLIPLSELPSFDNAVTYFASSAVCTVTCAMLLPIVST